MRRLLLSLALLLGLASPAQAHEIPAQHSVLVQAESDTVVVMVTWVAGNDLDNQLSARALWSRKDPSARKALRTMIAQKVLAPVAITLDGKALDWKSVETKISLDPQRSGRLAAAILMTAKVDKGAHTLDVRAANKESLRLKWLDRSKGRVASRIRKNTWQDKWTPLVLDWK